MSETATGQRAARMTQGTLDERAKASLDVLPAVLSKASQAKPVVRARTSAVLTVLESRRAEIIALLDAGYSANSLAIALHDGGIRFSVEAIRQALKRLKSGSKSSGSAPKARPNKARAAGSQSSQNSFAPSAASPVQSIPRPPIAGHQGARRPRI